MTGFLESELHGKLDLPGGAGVSGRGTRGVYHPEARAADLRNCARVTEVGVIEQVKELGTELDVF